MRYLLDELVAYEDGFGDILMHDRATERHETFMGSHQRSPDVLQSVDLHKGFEQLEAKLLMKFQGMLEEKLVNSTGKNHFLAGEFLLRAPTSFLALCPNFVTTTDSTCHTKPIPAACYAKPTPSSTSNK
jgi:hypothetical protein